MHVFLPPFDIDISMYLDATTWWHPLQTISVHRLPRVRWGYLTNAWPWQHRICKTRTGHMYHSYNALTSFDQQKINFWLSHSKSQRQGPWCAHILHYFRQCPRAKRPFDATFETDEYVFDQRTVNANTRKSSIRGPMQGYGAGSCPLEAPPKGGLSYEKRRTQIAFKGRTALAINHTWEWFIMIDISVIYPPVEASRMKSSWEISNNVFNPDDLLHTVEVQVYFSPFWSQGASQKYY